MAKTESKTRYVCLGSNASLFTDPNSGIKVISDWAVELPKNWRQSKRLVQATKSGHLEFVHEADLEDYTVKAWVPQIPAQKAEPKKEEVHTEESLMKLKKDQLIELAVNMGIEVDKEELAEYTKAEIAEEILDNQE